MKILIVLASILTIVLVLVVVILNLQNAGYRRITLDELKDEVDSYSGEKVSVRGFLVSYEGSYIGPKYYIAEELPEETFDIEEASQFAVSISEDSDINFENYISYEYNVGEWAEDEYVPIYEFTKISHKPVILKGEVYYPGACIGCFASIRAHEIIIDLD